MKGLSKKKKSIVIISMVIIILINSCILPHPVQAGWKQDVKEALYDIFFGGVYWLTVGVYQHINNFFVNDTYHIDVATWGDVPRADATDIGLTPENIIKGEFILFDANIFMDLSTDPEVPNKFDYDDPGGANGYVIEGKTEMRKIVAGWYYTLRNFAIIAFLSVLVYVAIRMIMSSISQDKAKYKNMFKDWLVALCLLIVMNYLMVGILNVTSMITKAIGNGSTSSTLTKNIAYDLYQFKENREIDDDGVHYTATDPEALETEWTTGTFLAYSLCFVVMTIYTVIFTVKYLKREFTIIFLVLLGPISCITYPIDKISDGKAQAFNKWLTEFIYQVLIQPFHLLLYLVLVGSAVTLASKNILYCIVCFAVLIPAEKFVKSMFGFKDTLGSPLQGMMKMDMFRNILGGAGFGGGGSGNKSPKENLPDDSDKAQKQGPALKDINTDDDSDNDDDDDDDDNDTPLPIDANEPPALPEGEPDDDEDSDDDIAARPQNDNTNGDSYDDSHGEDTLPLDDSTLHTDDTSQGDRGNDADNPPRTPPGGSQGPEGQPETVGSGTSENAKTLENEDKTENIDDNSLTDLDDEAEDEDTERGSLRERAGSFKNMVGNKFKRVANKVQGSDNKAVRAMLAIRRKHMARSQMKYGADGYGDAIKKSLWRGVKGAGKLGGRAIKGATTLGLKLTGAAVGGILGAMVGQGQAGAAAGMRLGGKAATAVNNKADEIASAIGEDVATGYHEITGGDKDKEDYFKDKRKIAIANRVYKDTHGGRKIATQKQLRETLGTMYELEQFRGINDSNIRDYATQYINNQEFLNSDEMSDADKAEIISQLDPKSIEGLSTDDAINMLMLTQSKSLGKHKAEDFKSLSKLRDMADSIAIPGVANAAFYKRIMNNGSKLADDGNEIRPKLLDQVFGPDSRRIEPQTGEPQQVGLPPQTDEPQDEVVDVPIVQPPFELTEPEDENRYGKMIFRLQEQGFDENQIQGILSGTDDLSDLEDSIDFIMGNGSEYKAARDAAAAFLGPDATKAQIDDEMYRRLLLKKAGIGLDKLDSIRTAENALDNTGLIDARAIANAAQGTGLLDDTESYQKLLADYTNSYRSQGFTAKEADTRARKALAVAKLYQTTQSNNPTDIKIPLNVGDGAGLSRPEIGRIGPEGAGPAVRLVAGIQLQGQGISANSAGYGAMVDALTSPADRVSVVTELEGNGISNPSNAQIDETALSRVTAARNVARQYDLTGARTDYIDGQLRLAGVGTAGVETARNLANRLNGEGVRPTSQDYTPLQQDIARRSRQEIARLSQLDGASFVQELDRLGIGHAKDTYSKQEIRTTINAANIIRDTKVPDSLGKISKGRSKEVRDITVQLRAEGYSKAQIEKFGEIAKKAGGSEKEVVERYRAISNFVKGDVAKNAASEIAGSKATKQVKKSEIAEIVGGTKGSFEQSALETSISERKKKLGTGRTTA